MELRIDVWIQVGLGVMVLIAGVVFALKRAGWGVGAGLKGATGLSRVDGASINLPWTAPVIACTASQKCQR